MPKLPFENQTDWSCCWQVKQCFAFVYRSGKWVGRFDLQELNLCKTTIQPRECFLTMTCVSARTPSSAGQRALFARSASQEVHADTHRSGFRNTVMSQRALMAILSVDNAVGSLLVPPAETGSFCPLWNTRKALALPLSRWSLACERSAGLSPKLAQPHAGTLVECQSLLARGAPVTAMRGAANANAGFFFSFPKKNPL